MGNDIATVPVTGGEAERLVVVTEDRPGIVYFGMRWEADGSTLFYSVNDTSPGSVINGIWAVTPDGVDDRLVARATDPEHGEPAVTQVSRQGDRLVAWYPRSAGRLDVRDPLALIDPSNGAATPLVVEETPEPHVARVQLATLSPDGTALLEVTRLTDPDFQVTVRDLGTGEVTTLVPGGLEVAGPPEYGMMPTWATNGTALITGGAPEQATLLTLDGGLLDESRQTRRGQRPKGPASVRSGLSSVRDDSPSGRHDARVGRKTGRRLLRRPGSP